jgi:hypothetical protein
LLTGLVVADVNHTKESDLEVIRNVLVSSSWYRGIHVAEQYKYSELHVFTFFEDGTLACKVRTDYPIEVACGTWKLNLDEDGAIHLRVPPAENVMLATDSLIAYDAEHGEMLLKSQGSGTWKHLSRYTLQLQCRPRN